MKLSYAFTAAATRGSAGTELLEVAGVVDELADGEAELPDVLGVLAVVTWLLSGALGPGFGELLLQPTTTMAITAARSATSRELRTCPPIGGDAAALGG